MYGKPQNFVAMEENWELKRESGKKIGEGKRRERWEEHMM